MLPQESITLETIKEQIQKVNEASYTVDIQPVFFGLLSRDSVLGKLFATMYSFSQGKIFGFADHTDALILMTILQQLDVVVEAGEQTQIIKDALLILQKLNINQFDSPLKEELTCLSRMLETYVRDREPVFKNSEASAEEGRKPSLGRHG